MRKLRFGEVNKPALGHTATKGWSPSSMIPEPGRRLMYCSQCLTWLLYCHPRWPRPHLGLLNANTPKCVALSPACCTRLLDCTWLFMVLPRDGLMWNLELSHVLSGNPSTGHTALNLYASWFKLLLELPLCYYIPTPMGNLPFWMTILTCLCFICLAILRCSY